MKILLVIITVISLFAFTSGMVLADSSGPLGPAPNSGDGIPDGSGMDSPNGGGVDAPKGVDGNVGSGTGPVGPAPNSGDGVPDGSGF